MYFDHCYTNDDKHKFLLKLKKLGFKLAKNKVEHPGKHICRFIIFGSSTPRKNQYLEFIFTKSGGKPFNNSGISMGIKKNLLKYSKGLKSSKYKMKYSHTNYDWKKDSKSKLPGWNFLNFMGTNIRGIYPWITEYEKRKTPRPIKVPKHKNGVYKIDSIIFRTNLSGEKFFKFLLKRQNLKNVKLVCGTRLEFHKSRNNGIKSIVLKCYNFDLFKSKYKPDSIIQLNNRPAAVIKNLNNKWNIVII